ncbi:unnamed protein product [Protopolystoma xenopodis]|uniref:Uncharacterized protein n=1 Tax=Protopolystoma xenopodis TaxID=117903 RepID=A0A3S5FGG6_9PLAT|nr:unnamed protein product [Protopolystoma xenopodis]
MCALLWQAECDLVTLAIHPEPSLSMGLTDSGLQSGSPHCLADPFLHFLVDRFHSDLVPVCFLIHALFVKALEARALPPHRAVRLRSDCHACRFQTFPSSIKPVI